MSTVSVKHHQMLIDGEWVDSDDAYEIHSPATEELVATVAKGTIERVHLPTGGNEEEGLAGGIKNGPALTLGAFYQGVLAFEGMHGFLDGLSVLLDCSGHAIDRLTNLVQIGKGQGDNSGGLLSLAQPLGRAR